MQCLYQDDRHVYILTMMTEMAKSIILVDVTPIYHASS